MAKDGLRVAELVVALGPIMSPTTDILEVGEMIHVIESAKIVSVDVVIEPCPSRTLSFPYE